MENQDNKLPVVLMAVQDFFVAFLAILVGVGMMVTALAVACYCLLVCVMVLMILWAVTNGWIILFAILWALLVGMVKVYRGEW